MMDIGKTNDNYIFYEGYEGEPEIILYIPNETTIHIWEGYFDDIYDTPSLDGKGWIGSQKIIIKSKEYSPVVAALQQSIPRNILRIYCCIKTKHLILRKLHRCSILW